MKGKGKEDMKERGGYEGRKKDMKGKGVYNGERRI